jgi:hypothetical protein
MYELSKRLVGFELTTSVTNNENDNSSNCFDKFKNLQHGSKSSLVDSDTTDKLVDEISNSETITSELTSPSRLKNRKRKLKNPVLSGILEEKSSQFDTCMVDFQTENDPPEKSSKKKSSATKSETPLDQLIDFRIEIEPPSRLFEDYFEISPDQSKRVEAFAPDNSLFLAVARALLYKIYFVDRNYEFLLRRVYLSDVDDEFVFNSDLTLQELLRRNLCIYWLSHVVDGEFVPHCKYQK